MPSPFPGMNPYLENSRSWRTFHNTFCTECLRSLAPQVAPAYIVQADENVYIHEFSANERRLAGRPDGFLVGDVPGAAPSTTLATLDAPAYARIPAAVDILREPFVLICDGESREVVTALELLSPTNKKAGPDREQYLAKRRRYFSGDVNFIEIDLLRGWERMPLEERPDCDYCVTVSRVAERPRVAIWPLGLRDRLPEIPVPLRPGEHAARLDLQQILHRVYDDLQFKNYIYRQTPQPALRPEDADWAREVLDAHGVLQN